MNDIIKKIEADQNSLSSFLFQILNDPSILPNNTKGTIYSMYLSLPHIYYFTNSFTLALLPTRPLK